MRLYLQWSVQGGIREKMIVLLPQLETLIIPGVSVVPEEVHPKR